MFLILSKNENEIEFVDAAFTYMEDALKPIDSSLLAIRNEIAETDIWSVGCLCDAGEYFIGLGFCIMQRYMFDVLSDVDINPAVARSLGPRTSLGEPIAELMHTAANYWKHEPEWHSWKDKLDDRSQKTVDKVLHHRESAHYPLSDLLADLNGDSELTLIGCLPYLTQWRQTVFERIENK